uniref:Slc47a-3 n=1 Tax=Schmidtea mediterranea TaxID=79327 RepID=A0A0H3YFD9_SCHMD|nr:slc47a-3 [Schmidtea mediterranea]
MSNKNIVNYDSYEKKNGTIEYNCKLCMKIFSKPTSFSKHMKVQHSINIHACRKCNETFSSLGHLFLHIKELHSKKKYSSLKFQCELCSYSTDNGGLYRHHQRAHSGNKPEVCDICNKGFTQHSNMKVHRKRHFKSSTDYYCEECDTTYGCHDVLLAHKASQEHNLTMLINRILKVKVEMTCQICNYKTVIIEEMMAHGMNCMCNNSITCNICSEKLLLNIKNLREHRKFHRNELLFCWECAENSERFTSKKSLINHLTKEHKFEFQRSYVCRYCESLFGNKTELLEHVNSSHSDKKFKHQPNEEVGRLVCNVMNCDFITNSLLLLEKHYKQTHDIEMKINEEDLPNIIVKTHQKGRPKICDLEIKTFEDLNSEIDIEYAPVKCRGRPKKPLVEKIPKKLGRPKLIKNLIKIESQ